MISDERIELIARRMCLFMGLDPEEQVMYGHGDDMTAAERSRIAEYYGIGLYGPRWCLYRAIAEQHIAAHEALKLE